MRVGAPPNGGMKLLLNRSETSKNHHMAVSPAELGRLIDSQTQTRKRERER